MRVRLGIAFLLCLVMAAPAGAEEADEPAGYRFGDYWRLGLPLSILVLVLGVPLILLMWPLA